MKQTGNGTDRLEAQNEELRRRVAELESRLNRIQAGYRAKGESRTWLYELLDKLPAIVYLQALDYSVPFANKFFIERFGRPEGRRCYEILRGQEAPCERCPTLSVLETGEPLSWEWTETVDGRAYLVHDYPFHDMDGTPLVLELGIDITDQKKILDELKRSSRLQDAILNNIPDMAWLKDTNYRYIAVNESLVAACGRPVEDIIGRTDFEIWPGWLAEQYRADDVEVVRTRRRKSVEEPMVGADGVEDWMHTIKTPFFDEHGGLMGLAGIARNISKRKKAEEELRKFKFILDRSGEEFYMLDADGRILYANEAVTRSLGYGRVELQGMKITQIARWVDEDTWREIFGRLKQGDTPPFESVHTTRDGREIPKEVKSVYLNIAGREHVCSFARDITERKRLEQERTDFLAMVSHDIRSPMTTVIGLAELISNTKRESLDADTLEMLGEIERGGRKVIKLVENFVTMARLETGKLPLKPFPTSMGLLVSECAADYGKRAADKSISLVAFADEGLPKPVLDRQLIERALGNLIGNAINYSPRGGSVTAGANVREENGVRYAELYVQDDGPGIPPEEHAAAFEKYKRLKSSRGVKGSGLGLSIVKAVAEAHGGRVELVSEEGKGARFAILIPLVEN